MQSPYKPLVIISLLLLVVSALPVSILASTVPVSGGSAAISCKSAVEATYKAMNNATAIQNAIHSQEYVRGVEGPENGTYQSIFQIDRTVTPYPTCVEEVLSYNVVFALYNKTGGYKASLVISENQSLAVEGSSVQMKVSFVNHNWTWGGIQAYANSGATQPIYAAETTFTQATAEYPNTGGCGTAGWCVFSSWAGVGDAKYGNGGHLAQDGTSGFCQASGSSCSSTTYFAWYQLYPDWTYATQCTSSTGGNVRVSPGQSIFAESESEAAYGGSSSKYDFYIYNNSNGDSCLSNGNSSAMASPVYGDFIVENPEAQVNGGYEPLAAFNPVPFTGSTIYTAGSYQTIDHFWWYAIDMENAPGTWPFCGTYVLNVDYGSGLGSNGGFTMTFDSNQYTPYYSAYGC